MKKMLTHGWPVTAVAAQSWCLQKWMEGQSAVPVRCVCCQEHDVSSAAE